MPRPHVLVVDDDRQIAQAVSLRLQHAGFELTAVTDGTECLETLDQLTPQLIVMDVRMPGMDGITALRHIRSQPKFAHINIIMLSASLRDRRVALDAGAQMFLTKPYRSTELMTAIEALTQDQLTANLV
ncbi:MAG: response regulator [Planctomycetales bacterium]|nr:response regulator [Planctomycetales bacterium]